MRCTLYLLTVCWDGQACPCTIAMEQSNSKSLVTNFTATPSSVSCTISFHIMQISMPCQHGIGKNHDHLENKILRQSAFQSSNKAQMCESTNIRFAQLRHQLKSIKRQSTCPSRASSLHVQLELQHQPPDSKHRPPAHRKANHCNPCLYSWQNASRHSIQTLSTGQRTSGYTLFLSLTYLTHSYFVHDYGITTASSSAWFPSPILSQWSYSVTPVLFRPAASPSRWRCYTHSMQFSQEPMRRIGTGVQSLQFAGLGWHIGSTKYSQHL